MAALRAHAVVLVSLFACATTRAYTSAQLIARAEADPMLTGGYQGERLIVDGVVADIRVVERSSVEIHRGASSPIAGYEVREALGLVALGDGRVQAFIEPRDREPFAGVRVGSSVRLECSYHQHSPGPDGRVIVTLDSCTNASRSK